MLDALTLAWRIHENSVAERIYRFNFKDNTSLTKEAQDEIEKNERTLGKASYEIAIPYIAAGAVERHSVEDYPYDQQSGGSDGSSHANYGRSNQYSSAVQNGAGSAGETGREGLVNPSDLQLLTSYSFCWYDNDR